MDTHEAVFPFAPQGGPARAKDGDLERWQISELGSGLDFGLRHLVIGQIRGQFRRWGGTLFLDRALPWLSSVHVWIDPASIDTDSVERDTHLRSSEFLDIARFPRAEFNSASIEGLEGKLIVHGRLQLHGVTHDIDLTVEAPPRTTALGRNVYSVRSKLDRQHFGLHWNQDLDVGGLVVGDEIALSAEVEIIHDETR